MSLPVGVGTDVVYERAVLQNSLHFSERDVLACLQFHQVLLAVYKDRARVRSLKRRNTCTIHACAQVCGCLTDDLEASVGVELPNVSGAEPPLAVLIHEEVVAVLDFVFVVTHGYVGTADQDFPPWVGLVCAVVATWRSTDLVRKRAAACRLSQRDAAIRLTLLPVLQGDLRTHQRCSNPSCAVVPH